jgi:hypothetical protein
MMIHSGAIEPRPLTRRIELFTVAGKVRYRQKAFNCRGFVP